MFSVIIATRDRPELLARALRSVAAQAYRRFELVLVDNSTSADARQRNQAALAEELSAATAILVPSSGGSSSGPSDTRNTGLARATRPYVAFLDDDDEWTDPDYLSMAAATIERLGLDLHFAEQEAVSADGGVVAGPVWSEDLADKLPPRGVVARNGTYVLSPEQVLLSDGFAHLNTTIVRRSLAWDRLGGFDPAIRYEEDKDFYLRAVDVAGTVGYTPRLVARHYVPAARVSASSISAEQKEAYRLAVLDKAIGSAGNPAIRARCRRDRVYTLKRMSLREAGCGEFAAAIRHGRAALRDQFGAKWAAFVASLYVRNALARRSHAG